MSLLVEEDLQFLFGNRVDSPTGQHVLTPSVGLFASIQKIVASASICKAKINGNIIPAELYENVFVTSDIHADYLQFLKLLVTNKLIGLPNVLSSDDITINNIYSYKFITHVEWIGGEKTLLVLVGDLLDGYRNGYQVKDLRGSFEVYLHAFLYNLRLKAHEKNSNVLFTLGNHDYSLLTRGTGLTRYIHETAFRFYDDPIQYGMPPYGKKQYNLLLPFYECCPYLFLEIKSEDRKCVLFVHAGFTSKVQNIGALKNLQTEILKRSIHEIVQENYKDIITVIDETKDTNVLWTREYAENQICPTNGYELEVVGHCPTSNQTRFHHHEVIKKNMNRYGSVGQCNRGCVLLGCYPDSKKYPTLAFVDISLSESFGPASGRAEMLLLQHTADGDDQPYYNEIYRIQQGKEGEATYTLSDKVNQLYTEEEVATQLTEKEAMRRFVERPSSRMPFGGLGHIGGPLGRPIGGFRKQTYKQKLRTRKHARITRHKRSKSARRTRRF